MLNGTKVKAARKALGLTGRAFAELVGVRPCTITKIERDDYPGISLELAIRVAQVLYMPVCALQKVPPPPHYHLEGGLPLWN